MIFNKDIEQHTQALADYLPNGIIFEAKNVYDSNFRQLLRGLAGEYRTAQGYITTLENEYLPDLTTLFIGEWERYLGIPDGCYLGTGTLEERRRDVLVKFASSGVQTTDDFVELAAIFGKAVTVTSLAEEAFPPYSVPFNPIGLPEARYVIVIEGEDLVGGVPPYAVPFDLTVGESLLECIFEHLKPANCDVIFRNSN